MLIGPGARLVAAGADLVLHDEVFVGQHTTLVAMARLTVGARTLIAENCMIHTENHGPAGDRNAYTYAPITIGEDAWIGGGVAVLRGSVIGDRVTVGANAVVRGELEADGTYVGAPARRIGSGA